MQSNVVSKFISLPFRLKIEYIFYPIFLFYRVPLAWLSSLWSARVLLDGKWSNYMGFHPYNSINSLFYRTQWINLDRYGRSNISPLLGLDKYSLSNWFHLSLPASYIYPNAGAVTTLSSTIIWALAHIIWANSILTWWVLAVVFVLLLSTTSYAMAFARQNYQMLGWMWLPFALYFTSSNNLVLAAFAWFAASLSGITIFLFSFLIVSAFAILTLNAFLPLILLPSLLPVFAPFLPLAKSNHIKASLLNIAKLIGLSKRNVRYKYPKRKLNFTTLYLSLLYFICFVLMSLGEQSLAVFPLFGLILFIFNQCFFRVADEQSLIVVISSLFAYSVLQNQPSFIALIAFWLAVNPIGYVFSVQSLDHGNGTAKIIVNPPFDHTGLEIGVTKFLEHAPVGSRILFAFDDPGNLYSNLFDGYVVIHEMSLYVSSKLGIHLFPDWWAVGETNYDGAPSCWGRTCREVLDNCLRWNACYAVIYQESGSDLADCWVDQFILISEFDWACYLPLFRDNKLWSSRPTPKWFLLRRK